MPGPHRKVPTCAEGEKGLKTPLGEAFRAFKGCTQSWLRVRARESQARIGELQKEIRELGWSAGKAEAPSTGPSIEDLRKRLERWTNYHGALRLLSTQSRYRVSILRIKVKERPYLLAKSFFVSRGEVLDILEENRSWYKVRTADGRVGYLEKGSVVLGKPVRLNSKPGLRKGRADDSALDGGRG